MNKQKIIRDVILAELRDLLAKAPKLKEARDTAKSEYKRRHFANTLETNNLKALQLLAALERLPIEPAKDEKQEEKVEVKNEQDSKSGN